MAERSYNGRNVIDGRNGDFENVPTFVAPTTANSGWIDGTASGSPSDDTYGWRLSGTGTSSAQFDTSTFKNGGAALKLSTLASASYKTAYTGAISGSLPDIIAYGTKLIPGRTYTLKGWMKTNYISGDAAIGAQLACVVRNGAGAGLTTQSTTAIKGTSDWTYYQKTFIAPSAADTCVIELRLYGHTGAATLIMDAWFDDISLTEVLPERTPITTPRATATNRVAVRDMGTALRFDGVDDYVGANTVASTGFSGVLPTEFTISCWAKTNTSSAQTIIGFGKNPDDNSFIVLRIGSIGAGRAEIVTRNTAAQQDVASNTNRTDDGEWHNYTGVKTATSLLFYVDGLLVASDLTLNGGTYTFNRFSIGALNRASLSTYFNGTIDEPRIWNRALTATEIANLYFNNTVPRNGLVGEWLFNETTGSTALDTSGNGNDGVISGCTYTLDVPLKARIAV